jgi:hypothetical protein
VYFGFVGLQNATAITRLTFLGIHLSNAAGPRFRPITYISGLLVAAVCAYLYTVHTRSAFACPATGYSADRYLAYCGATEYGDFDHGAFWFGLIPGVRERIRAADALFLGNSRMQFGFSGEPTRRWFGAAGFSHYLMGFAYWENFNFESALLKKADISPKIVIINVDSFFVPEVTEPAKAVMHDPAALDHYRRKRFWQGPHSYICGIFPAFCGDTESFYRSVSTGHYLRQGGKAGDFPVSDDPAIDPAALQFSATAADRFVRELGVDRSCVVFTIVPTQGTKRAQADALARRLNVQLISPQLPGLTTFDKSHLNAPSGARWSAAFFEQAEPVLRRCLAAPRTR